MFAPCLFPYDILHPWNGRDDSGQRLQKILRGMIAGASTTLKDILTGNDESRSLKRNPPDEVNYAVAIA